MTRDSYLETAYLGRVPEEIDAEIEAEGQAQLDEYYGRRDEEECLHTLLSHEVRHV